MAVAVLAFEEGRTSTKLQRRAAYIAQVTIHGAQRVRTRPALDSLYTLRKLRAYITDFSQASTRRQGVETCSRSAQATVDERAAATSGECWRHRSAYLVLLDQGS